MIINNNNNTRYFCEWIHSRSAVLFGHIQIIIYGGFTRKFEHGFASIKWSFQFMYSGVLNACKTFLDYCYH